ncbi:MAG TPA: IS1595 family transposase [Candidatus Acidoferrales bacterium]|nr:IS1595 family transposase [Candidatus Acidoferrales bacterium]
MAPVNRNDPIRATTSESRYSLMEFMRDYPDDATCLDWLWRTRYSDDGIHADCPKCDRQRAFKKYATAQSRQSWTCTACGHHIQPTAGTIFHKSSTSLHLWFYAMYLMTSTRCGISAKQLEREIGCTYKTAWRMLHLIRHELMSDDSEPLRGHVEIDEMYVGGKRRGMLGVPKLQGKQPVLGMVERKGRVIATTVENASRAALMPHVEKYVLPESVVYTDEWKSYRQLGKNGYQHKRIQHKENIYVSGSVHTNTIEGFWSLVKRGLDGVYHSVSAKHLQGYLDEYAWRYNHREDGRAQFDALIERAAQA